MRSIFHTTIRTRTGQCLAAAALMAGVAFGASPIASAAWDQASFDKCVKDTVNTASSDREFQWLLCCQQNGGTPTKDDLGIGCKHDNAPPLSAPPELTGKPPGAPPLVEGDLGPRAPLGPVPIAPAERG